MSFSGKQKKAELKEKRERDRLREQQEAARVKAQLIAGDQERERKRQLEREGSTTTSTATNTSHHQNELEEEDDEDDDIGIVPVRRVVASSSSVVKTRPTPIPAPAVPLFYQEDMDDQQEEGGGIIPLRRVIRFRGRIVYPPSAKDDAAGAASSVPSAFASAGAASSAASVPTTIGAASSSANKLRTAFARESDEVIEERKAASRLPLKRDHLSQDGGTPSEDYYANEEIPIPTRPDWQGLTPAELEANEVNYFTSWLENIYSRYGQDRLNHFEHNLEVWRQLWRVCERSDILLVIVDSRQPILNFPPSLYHYITLTLKKPMILVLNKIDLIPKSTVNDWISYFHQRYPKLFVVPFTSYPAERMEKLDHLSKSKAKRGRGMTLLKPYGATELLDACRKIVSDSSSMATIPDEVRRSFSFDPTLLGGGTGVSEKQEQYYASAEEYMKVPSKNDSDDEDLGASSLSKELKELGVLKRSKADKKRQEQVRRANALAEEPDEDDLDSSAKKKSKKATKSVRLADYPEEEEMDSEDEATAEAVEANTKKYAGVLGRLEETPATNRPNEFITLGSIGQPNAGKSSLINALAGKKLVSVSKTPGHTKYLQTLFLNESTRLCDCPGLVFPAVDMPRALQVIAGSFPIAQTREPYSAIQFLAERLPLEQIYKLTPPDEANTKLEPHEEAGDKSTQTKSSTSSTTALTQFECPWSAWSLCESLAKKKGFFNRKGDPDVYRAANFVLREVLDGVITFFFTPPTNTNKH